MTGGNGFLGRHVRALLRALGHPVPVLLTRADLSDPELVAARTTGVDRVLHLAGVNRGDPADVAAGNVQLAAALAGGLRRCPVPPARVVFANSTQSGNGTPYGDSKAAAATTLARATAAVTDFVDIRLPNLYGEHGRPYYNSVVATFCRLLADGGTPDVHDDRELDLVHAGDAAARLLDVPTGGSWDPGLPPFRTGVRALAELLAGYAATYRSGEIPPLPDRHAIRLFNTYRSHCFPGHCPIELDRHGDPRGNLVEVARSHGGGGQTFCSTTRPGITRGDHFHLAKVERFVVLRGRAEIALRRVDEAEVLRFPVDGDRPVAVDMPSMWAHRITNTGPDELLTAFWSNELFDPRRPDTYPEPVTGPALVPAVAR